MIFLSQSAGVAAFSQVHDNERSMVRVFAIQVQSFIRSGAIAE
jgi:hypothetical protein